MKIYRGLTWIFPRSFRAKLMSVVIVCTTLPVSVFALWLMWNNGAPPEQLLWGTAVATAVTLTGAVGALFLIYQLLSPLRHAADALDAYYTEQQMPRLPECGDDEMGRLLRGLNRCLRGIDAGVRQLERHALEDPLTGAMNRRGCEQALAESVAAATADGLSFVLFVVDLDNLKTINDEYGHAAGDRALRELVGTASHCLQGREWIGRWGGDEFLLGLHDEVGSARQRVAAWLQALASPRDVGLPVYASAGCAEYHQHDAMHLYREADAAMYEAKFSGGQRLVCHSAARATGEARYQARRQSC